MFEVLCPGSQRSLIIVAVTEGVEASVMLPFFLFAILNFHMASENNILIILLCWNHIKETSVSHSSGFKGGILSSM